MRRGAGLLGVLLLTFLAGWFGHSLFGSRVEPRPSPDRESPGTTDTGSLPGSPRLEAAPREQPAAIKSAPAAPAEFPVVGSSTQSAPRSGDAVNGTLRVRVREFSGKPVPGIAVSALGGPSPVSGTTDADGLAEFAALSPGEWRVQTTFPEGVQAANAAVYAGRLTELSLVHPARGVRFEGIVRDAAKGPVEGVTVTLSSLEGTLHTKTNANGFYRFDGVRPGGWNVSLSSNASTSGFSQSNRVFVPPDETFRKDFLAGPLLRGTVRDRTTRAPIAGVRVQSQQGGRYLDIVTTSADGTFGLQGLSPGTFELMLSRSGYGLTIVRNIEVSAEGTAVDLEMSPAARLRLHITDAQGRPASGTFSFGFSSMTADQGISVGTDIRADSEGKASYDEIPPGSYVLSFKAEGLGEARVETTLALGENTLEVRLETK